jgi:hypothetical protein
MKRAALLLLLFSLPALAADEFTLYELLPPESHQFAITYDVTQDREGAALFFNPIRAGSIATQTRYHRFYWHGYRKCYRQLVIGPYVCRHYWL